MEKFLVMFIEKDKITLIKITIKNLRVIWTF